MNSKELVGQQVYGDYRVTRLMDKGGMGLLYLARHETQPDRRVVLKVFTPEVVRDATAYARARMEAEVISAMRHPHIARILDFDELPSGQPFMVVEHLEGEGLGARLKRKPMSAVAAARMLQQIGGALEEVHDQDIFHRDLKPGYLFCVRSGDDDEPRMKLLNFGISKLRDPLATRRSRTPFARAYFTSPEQLDDPRVKPDNTTDIFSMGCITYLALTGEVPFPATSRAKYLERVKGKEIAPLAERLPNMPPEADAILCKAMAPNREERYQRVGELVAALVQVLESLPTEPAPEEAAPPARVEERSRPHKLTPEEKSRLPRVLQPEADLPNHVDLSKLVSPASPAPSRVGQSAAQPFEDHATVLMDDDELVQADTVPAAKPQAPRPTRDTGPPRLQDAVFVARKTAIAPPMEPDEEDEEEHEEIVLRDVSQTEEDDTTTSIMGVDELGCEAADEDVTGLIPLADLLEPETGEHEEETSTIIAIDLSDVEEVEDGEVGFKDTVASPPTLPMPEGEEDDFVDAPTTQYEEVGGAPRTEFADGMRLRDMSDEVDEEAETEVHDRADHDER